MTGNHPGDRASSEPASPSPPDLPPSANGVLPPASVDQNGEIPRSFLRRQPARIVAGRIEGGYTSAFEVIRCDCGDNPDLDCSEISPWVQQIRWPYPLHEGLTAYEQHLAIDYLMAGAR
jgi:hypothetical protein